MTFTLSTPLLFHSGVVNRDVSVVMITDDGTSLKGMRFIESKGEEAVACILCDAFFSAAKCLGLCTACLELGAPPLAAA